MKILTQFKIKHRYFFFLSLFLSLSCVSKNSTDPYKEGIFATPNGDEIKVTLALSESDQQRGLSGLRPSDFSKDQGMLFYSLEDDLRSFWMPDTYFDLDIFFLDKDFKIIDVDRKVPHYIGKEFPERIPRTRTVYARHVFEMRADSEIAKNLKVNDQLIWKFQVSPSQIESKIRQLQ
jgi:uncharacterized membrane protein (UPF0127 family)